MCVPFAFAFFLLRRNAARFALLVVTLVMVVACDIYTGSRGGQLVFLAANGVYFYRRYGARGLVLGAVLVLPVLILGGRSDEGATESSQGRIELLGVAMGLFRLHPLTGVGYSNFGEYASHTAHNSYALVAAESGFLGLLLWTAVLYSCVKSALAAIVRYEKRPEAEAAYVWAGALLSAQCGLLVGIFFLSFNFSSILWVFLGICGAFYAALRRHDPELRVTLGWTDWKRIFVLSGVFVIVCFLYTRFVTE
jgi:O-antigen ligase